MNIWEKKAPFNVIKGLGQKTWKKIALYGLKSQTAAVDTVVTTDIHRLIRLPGTLHGKTGLKVTKISLDDLDCFDPLNDSIVFDGNKKIFINEAPCFRIGKETFGPYKQETIELPMAVVIYLICKGVANIA